MPQVRRVPESKLFVSQPPPHMFGNDQNPKDWKAKGWTNANWLKSRFHKNFAEYRSSQNPPFGCLYVCNDDLVQPRTGFGPHPHREMEIVTYIVEGYLTHEDSKGNRETLGRGSVQFMSAGTGLYHSEANNADTPCRFIQSWILPGKRGISPRYGSYKAAGAAEGLKHLISSCDSSHDTPVKLAQDVDIYAGVLKPGATEVIEIGNGRQGYFLCMEGSASLKAQDSSANLVRHDAAELYGPASITVTAGSEGLHVQLFTMKRDGNGRTDL